MNRLKTFFFLITSIVILFVSCSIEKRVHLPGYHLTQNKSNKTTLKVDENKTQENKTDLLSNSLTVNRVDNLDETLLASATDDVLLPNSILKLDQAQNKKSIIQINNSNQLDNECDVIVLKNGDEVMAKVLEIGITEIKYVNCDNRSGPTFIILKKDVFMIKYPNGTKTVFNEEQPSNKNQYTDPYLQTFDSDDKSFGIAVALWFFLGLLGVHRFYLGHIGIGILYLLTAGLCGIGWVVDGILFLTGQLKPRNGKYIDF